MRRAVAVTAAGAAASAAAVLVTRPGPGDYGNRLIDDAEPLIDALLDGRLGDAPDAQPLMGLVSIAARLPAAAIGRLFDGLALEYRLGAFVCLLALAVLVLAAVTAGSTTTGRERVLGGVLALLVGAFGPFALDAIEAGHPEDLLLAALAVGGVWAVAAGRVTAGAVLIGLAIGTKPFGVFALVAGLLAAPASARSLLTVALPVAAVGVLPLPLLAPGEFLDAARELSGYRRIYAESLWWLTGHDQSLITGVGTHSIRLMPDGLTRGTGTLAVFLFATVATALVARRARGRALGLNAIAFVGALFIARGALDSLNLEYYALPGIVALLVWELVARERAPLLTAALVGASIPVFDPDIGARPRAVMFAIWAMVAMAIMLRASTPPRASSAR